MATSEYSEIVSVLEHRLSEDISNAEKFEIKRLLSFYYRKTKQIQTSKIEVTYQSKMNYE